MKLRCLVIAVAFLAAFASDSRGQSKQPSPSTNAPSKQSAQPTAGDQRGTDQSPVTVKILPAPDTEKQAEKQERERQEKQLIDKKLAFDTQRIADYTWWLASITGLLFAVAVIQAGFFFVQLGIMKIGMVDATTAAKASEASAKAATEQTEIAKESFAKLERPYLYVTAVGAPILDRKSAIGDSVLYVTYTVANYGKTPAIIKHAQGICHGIDGKIAVDPDIPLAFDYDHILVSSPIMRAGEIREGVREDVAKDSVNWTSDEHFTLETIDEYFPSSDQDVFLWIILTYRGPFTDQHEISACWRWDHGSRRFVKHGKNNWEK